MTRFSPSRRQERPQRFAGQAGLVRRSVANPSLAVHPKHAVAAEPPAPAIHVTNSAIFERIAQSGECFRPGQFVRFPQGTGKAPWLGTRPHRRPRGHRRRGRRPVLARLPSTAAARRSRPPAHRTPRPGARRPGLAKRSPGWRRRRCGTGRPGGGSCRPPPARGWRRWRRACRPPRPPRASGRGHDAGRPGHPAATGPSAVSVALRVNGADLALSIDPRVSLLDLLRETLQLPGTKKGCNQGACGACTVLVDGERILSCLTLAVQSKGGTSRPSKGSLTTPGFTRCSKRSSSMMASSAATAPQGRSARRWGWWPSWSAACRATSRPTCRPTRSRSPTTSCASG
jgi:hypothetical protein